MAQSKQVNSEFFIKANGRIDFGKPPKGKIFVPIPTDEEDIKRREIDRRFVTRHKFSGTIMLVVMELVDEEEEDKAKAFVAETKRECKNEERRARCKIKSPKTGELIFCPDSISCYGDKCPKNYGLSVEPGRPDSLDDDGMEETIKLSCNSVDPTADAAIVNYMWDSFLEKLSKEDRILTYIARRVEEGYKAAEILKMIGKAETEISWFYRQKDKIRNRWIKYNID